MYQKINEVTRTLQNSKFVSYIIQRKMDKSLEPMCKIQRHSMAQGGRQPDHSDKEPHGAQVVLMINCGSRAEKSSYQ